jgi:transposase-like protein
MNNRTYSPEFKLQVLLEALQPGGTDGDMDRAYDVHPVTLSSWKKKLKENGSTAFGGGDKVYRHPHPKEGHTDGMKCFTSVPNPLRLIRLRRGYKRIVSGE